MSGSRVNKRGRGKSVSERIANVLAEAEIVPGVYSNPGAGTVLAYGESVCFENALANTQVLLADTDSELKILSSCENADESGRYLFVLASADGETVEVEMPGLPLAAVRFERGQASAWNFPRLYVDGSSWLWAYAVNILRAFVDGEE